MSSQLMEYFNQAPRIGTLNTAGAGGKVDIAVYGSPRPTDDRTVILGSGPNRSLANLRQNPRAVFMIMEPGKSIMDWKGVRVYMTQKDLATSGPAFDEHIAQIAWVAGERRGGRRVHDPRPRDLQDHRGPADPGHRPGLGTLDLRE